MLRLLFWFVRKEATALPVLNYSIVIRNHTRHMRLSDLVARRLKGSIDSYIIRNFQGLGKTVDNRQRAE